MRCEESLYLLQKDYQRRNQWSNRQPSCFPCLRYIISYKDGFEKDQLISAGNFHGEYVAKASDFIGMALFNLGRFS
jgi:hypothetical protein